MSLQFTTASLEQNFATLFVGDDPIPKKEDLIHFCDVLEKDCTNRFLLHECLFKFFEKMYEIGDRLEALCKYSINARYCQDKSVNRNKKHNPILFLYDLYEEVCKKDSHVNEGFIFYFEEKAMHLIIFNRVLPSRVQDINQMFKSLALFKLSCLFNTCSIHISKCPCCIANAIESNE